MPSIVRISIVYYLASRELTSNPGSSPGPGPGPGPNS